MIEEILTLFVIYFVVVPMMFLLAFIFAKIFIWFLN